MAKMTKNTATELLKAGYITQEAYDQMFSDGIVSSGTRSTRPQVHVPVEHKDAFLEKAYDSFVTIAEELGFDFNTPTADSGQATLYLKGAGKPRTEDEVESGELAE